MKKFKTQIFNRSEILEDQWNHFVDHSPQAVIYAYTWYLDIVCERWIAIISLTSEGEWLAVMPIPIYKKFIFSRCYMPLLCQHLAIFYAAQIGHSSCKKEKELALKKRILTNSIEMMPANIKIFKYNISAQNLYLLPFFWKNYRLAIKYSYHLSIEKDKQVNFQLFSHKTRTCINKALKNGLVCKATSSIDKIIEIGKRNIKVPFDGNKLQNIWEVLYAKQLIKAVEVTDENGQLHSGIIYLKNQHRYIYLFGTVEEQFKDLGAMSLAIWHIIKNSETGIKTHDFQGSMLESIEKFYRGFGASPVVYTQIYKNSLTLPLKMVRHLHKSLKFIKPF